MRNERQYTNFKPYELSISPSLVSLDGTFIRKKSNSKFTNDGLRSRNKSVIRGRTLENSDSNIISI